MLFHSLFEVIGHVDRNRGHTETYVDTEYCAFRCILYHPDSTASRHKGRIVRRSNESLQRARTLAEQAEEHGVTTGVHPAGFAAACLYKAGQEQGQWVTQSDVAKIKNVTPTTDRTHHETLDELAV
nr:hypothetical protein [Halanaeroarchaeum sulfurireducens]